MPMNPPEHTDLTRALHAADRLDIMQLAARFDNALDAEDASRFVSAFVPDGVLAGFWGESKGPEQIEGAFHFMLATFARNRRHVISNQEIELTGDSAHMHSYLTVFDRQTLSLIDTAAFRDTLTRNEGAWLFTRRTLMADSNVDSMIESIRSRA